MTRRTFLLLCFFLLRTKPERLDDMISGRRRAIA